VTTLLYAMGTGLGHLVRARAFAHGHGLRPLVLTTHPQADRVLGDLPRVVLPDDHRLEGDRLRSALARVIAEHGVEHVILDVFPAGIRGELGDWTPPGGQVSLLARRLGRPPRAGPPIGVAYRCEALERWQDDWLTARADVVQDARLVDPPALLPQPVSAWLDVLPRPIWAVVHSGSLDELHLLVDHARDDAFARGLSPTLLIVHPDAPPIPGTLPCRLQPAWPLFSKVDRVVGGAGFNLVRQALSVRVPHLAIPLPRRFDDQPGRARALRTTGATPG